MLHTQNSFVITAQSAAEVAAICIRQAAKDSRTIAHYGYRVYQALSSPHAMQTYRWLWRALCLICHAVWLLGYTLRGVLDGYVERCLEQPVAAPAVPDVDIDMEAELAAYDQRRQAEAVAAPIAQLTTRELHKLAKARGISYYKRRTKAELVGLLA